MTPITTTEVATSLADLTADRWHVVAVRHRGVEREWFEYTVSQIDLKAGVETGWLTTVQGRRDGAIVLFAKVAR